MVGPSANPIDVRMLLPETLWLESEQFEQAKAASAQWEQEAQQWQAYLNALATLSFQIWLEEKLSSKARQMTVEGTEAAYLSIKDFKLCLLAQEHVLDELVQLPRKVIEQPEWVAHGYVVLEVLEEQEEVAIRGFLRYDELMSRLEQRSPASDGEYLLSLSSFDEEINHLVAYLQYSHPDAIPLPVLSTQPSTPATAVSSPVRTKADSLRTRLGQWLDGTLVEGWQTLDRLINPEANLAWSTRQKNESVSGGKLLNLGMQLGQRSVVLLITVVPENEEKIGINIQILPTGDDTVLPHDLAARLISSTDKVLQSVTSREQDNYIQMKPFKGKPGIQFGIEVELDGVKVSEAFEL